jgi:hypothetical protein
MRDFFKALYILLLPVAFLIWFMQTSISAYWQETYHYELRMLDDNVVWDAGRHIQNAAVKQQQAIKEELKQFDVRVVETINKIWFAPEQQPEQLPEQVASVVVSDIVTPVGLSTHETGQIHRVSAVRTERVRHVEHAAPVVKDKNVMLPPYGSGVIGPHARRRPPCPAYFIGKIPDQEY